MIIQISFGKTNKSAMLLIIITLTIMSILTTIMQRRLEQFATASISEKAFADSTARQNPSFEKDNMNGDGQGRGLDEGKPLLRDLVTDVKYKNAYYYELDNDSFDAALQRSFQPSTQGLKETTWSPADITSVPVQTAYTALIDRITSTLRSPQAFSLPDGSFSRLQITHDRLIDAMIGTSATATTTVTMLKSEMTWYRESKYQGKSIGCVCTVDDSGNVNFVQMKVLGVVSADHIRGLSLPGIGTTIA